MGYKGATCAFAFLSLSWVALAGRGHANNYWQSHKRQGDLVSAPFSALPAAHASLSRVDLEKAAKEATAGEAKVKLPPGEEATSGRVLVASKAKGRAPGGGGGEATNRERARDAAMAGPLAKREAHKAEKAAGHTHHKGGKTHDRGSASRTKSVSQEDPLPRHQHQLPAVEVPLQVPAADPSTKKQTGQSELNRETRRLEEQEHTLLGNLGFTKASVSRLKTVLEEAPVFGEPKSSLRDKVVTAPTACKGVGCVGHPPEWVKQTEHTLLHNAGVPEPSHQADAPETADADSHAGSKTAWEVEWDSARSDLDRDTERPIYEEMKAIEKGAHELAQQARGDIVELGEDLPIRTSQRASLAKAADQMADVQGKAMRETIRMGNAFKAAKAASQRVETDAHLRAAAVEDLRQMSNAVDHLIQVEASAERGLESKS